MRIEEPSIGNAVDFTFDPSKLLDCLITRLSLTNDAALSRALEVSPAVISKIRNRRSPVTAGILICMHEASGLSIRELREIMRDRRPHFHDRLFSRRT